MQTLKIISPEYDKENIFQVEDHVTIHRPGDEYYQSYFETKDVNKEYKAVVASFDGVSNMNYVIGTNEDAFIMNAMGKTVARV